MPLLWIGICQLSYRKKKECDTKNPVNWKNCIGFIQLERGL
ncbi:hypothetical protein GYH30_036138 [Glycine max]|nr:hypothetical protein GYH30_036138 [Glycine max]